MTLKHLAPLLGAALLMSGAVARADTYQPGEFLMLDLNRAALSPKPLGPPARFEPVPIEAKADPAKVAPAAKSGAHRRRKTARCCPQENRTGPHQPPRRQRVGHPRPGLALPFRRYLQLAEIIVYATRSPPSLRALTKLALPTLS
ncbi:hypothetical protein V1284_003402 [Nitrobacteraceae bacterium AZCC 2299]